MHGSEWEGRSVTIFSTPNSMSFQFTDGSLGYWLKNVHGVTLAAQAFTDYCLLFTVHSLPKPISIWEKDRLF